MRHVERHLHPWPHSVFGRALCPGLVILTLLLGSTVASAYELDLDLPVASSVAAAGPDLFTGTMGAIIPIDVPQGRRGVQPNLALVYRGGNGNGPVGVGWKLDLGGIERQSRFGVDFNGNAYVLKLNGVTMDLVADQSVQGQYWAKIEGSFNRILKNTAGDGKPYWEVTDRKGTKYLFGQTAGSRQDDPNNASQIFRWCLEKIVDPFGNVMKVTYVKDQGQIYVDQIDYATDRNAETNPYFRVKVYRAPIGTAATGATASPVYTAGFSVTTAKLVKAIQVTSKNGSANVQMRVYALSYTTSPQTKLPRLDTAQQFGKDATITVDPSTSAITVTGPSYLPSQRLTYSTDPAPNQFVDQGTQPSSPCAGGSPMGSGDFNGDGQGDLWCHEHTTSGPTYIALSTATGQLNNWSQVVTGWCGTGFYFTTGDANGDGLTDLICHGGSTTYVLPAVLNSGVPVFTVPPDAGIWRQNWCPGGNNGNPSNYFGVGDFDGDGRTDIRCYDGGVRVQVSNGSAFVTVTGGQELWRTTWCPTGDVFGTDDFNGDGKADIFCRTGGDYRVSLSNGIQFVVGPSSDLWRTGWCSGGTFNGLGDFNGDGKADWYCRDEDGSGRIRVQLSTGSAFVAGPNGDQWQPSWCWPGAQVGSGDFNGDGKGDLYCHGGGAMWVGISNGQAFALTTPDGTWLSNWCPDGALFAVRDLNGDGKTDLWCREGTGTMHVAQSGSSGTGLPDSLTKIENGLGGSATMTYGSWTPAISTGKPFTIQTVKTLLTDDGNGITATTQYLYEAGYYHVMLREFRGFNKVTVTGPPGPQSLPSEQRKTVVWFHQGDDLGLTNNPVTPNGFMRGKPYQVTVVDAQGTAYVDRTITYTTGKSGKPYFFNPPQTVSTKSCDGSSCATAKSRTTAYTYDEGYTDEYANVTTEIQSGTGTTSRTIARTFNPNTAVWIVSLPAQEQIKDGATIKASTTFYYDQVTDCGSAATQQQPTLGALTRVVRGVAPDPLVETRMAYDAYGNPKCQRDANGHQTNITYSSSTLQATQPESVRRYLNYPSTSGSLLTEFQYYNCNVTCTPGGGLNSLLKKVKQPNNDDITYEYDALARMSMKSVVFDISSYVTTYAYPGWGTVGQQASRITDPTGMVTTTYFDGLRRTIKVTTTGPGNLVATKTEYEARGYARRQSIPYFQVTGQETPAAWTTVSYDLLGRQTKVVNPDQSTAQFCENNWVRVSVDPRGLRRVTTRDAFGRVVDVQDNASIFATCDTGNQYAYKHYTYEYDVLENLLRVVDTGGNEVKFFYDSLSRPTELRDPDLGRWTYEYDLGGNLRKQTDARSRIIHFQYDGLDRLKQQDYDTANPRPLGDANADVVYTYDENLLLTSCPLAYIGKGAGRLTTRKEVNGNEVKYVYDRIGRIIENRRKVSGDLRCNSFAYDGRDRLTTVYYGADGRADYEYNGPWLKRVYEGSTNYAQFASFTTAGQPGTMTLGNGVQTTLTYATESYGTGTCQQYSFRLCQLAAAKGGVTLLNQTYGYDVNSNVTAITDPIGGNQSHTYDNNDRLMATSGPVWNTQFGFNEMDNLTFWAVVGGYAYPANQLGYGHHPHAVCATGSATCGTGTQYTYDASGNMTGGAGRTLVYDAVNRLTSVTTAGGTTSFVYDGDSARVQKTVPIGGGGTKTVKYFDKWVECETSGGTTACTKYIWAGDLRVAMKQVTGGALTYYHGNHLGSTAVVTDGAGTQQETIQYYPFGEQWTDTGPANVPYKYTGQEYDASTGLYFYKARYYDAHLGRFIQPDTIVLDPYVPASWNRYSYVLNNPLKYTDPSGHYTIPGHFGYTWDHLSQKGVGFWEKLMTSWNTGMVDFGTQGTHRADTSIHVMAGKDGIMGTYESRFEALNDGLNRIAGAILNHDTANLYHTVQDATAPPHDLNQWLGLKAVDEFLQHVLGDAAPTSLHEAAAAYNMKVADQAQFNYDTGFLQAGDIKSYMQSNLILPDPAQPGQLNLNGIPAQDVFGISAKPPEPSWWDTLSGWFTGGAPAQPQQWGF